MNMSQTNTTYDREREPVAPDQRAAADECVECGPLVRREFWSAFKWHMEANSSVNCARVTTDGWIWHNTDLTMGNMLSFVRVRLGDIGVKYTLNDAHAETVYAFIRRHGDTVEDAFNHPLQVARWRRRWVGDCIEVRRPIESFRKETWPSHFDWLQRQLETFRVGLLPAWWDASLPRARSAPGRAALPA